MYMHLCDTDKEKRRAFYTSCAELRMSEKEIRSELASYWWLTELGQCH